MSFRFSAELLYMFRCFMQVLKHCSQRISIALLERHPMSGKHIGALGDIGRYATSSVCHGFQKAHGHAFNIRRQDVAIGIRVELRQSIASHEARKQNSLVALCHIPQLFLVLRGIRGTASNHEPFVCIKPLESFNQQLWSLFRNKSSQEEDVGVLLQTPTFLDLVCWSIFLRIHTVGDKNSTSIISLFEVILRRMREHDNLIRALGSSLFAMLDIRGTQLAPLGTLPI